MTTSRTPRTHWLGFFLLITAVAGTWGCPKMPQPPPAQRPEVPKLLSNPHQLSFEGRRSGEGYYSRDGNLLIFQSEREPENPFYQIYTLDLRSGASRLVSPGVGKSTCGFIHPGGRLALFSSTYLDPDFESKQQAEFELRAAGKARRYSWDYDAHYDIFSVPLDRPEDRSPKRLTDSKGYDAEGAWSPNGREIVFASNRHAHEPGAEIDPEHLKDDPAHYLDIYIMDSTGRNVRRLTTSPGYDGGPFFSPDGERIIWRHFSLDGTRAEIYSMQKDGTDVVQLTHLDAMSWAPFYHPSGEYVIFSTNLHGHDNFELYIVDVRGEHLPVRVTDSPGFDGLPSFSPSGDELVWTSNRTPSRQSQLFRSDWNDSLARGLLGLPASRGPSAQALLPLPANLDPKIEAQDLRAHVEALTNPVTSGRLTGTAGEKIASSYVARSFRSLGLEPAGDSGTYFESFGFTAGLSLGAKNRLKLIPGNGSPIEYEVDVDWRPFAFSREGETGPLKVVYAGYGIQAPQTEGQRAIDDFAGLDLTDRWVLVFRYIPESLSPESRQHLHRYSSLRHKAMVARDRGAHGILVMSGPRSKVREELAPLQFDVSLAGSSIAALSITDALAQQLLDATGRQLETLQEEADANSANAGFEIPDIAVSAEVGLERQRRTGRNVIGRLQVGSTPSTEWVVLGAHLDHLGKGGSSSSLANEEDKDEIHPGADDNASGVAALLEIAQYQASLLAQGELTADRDIVFAAWSGEELGLLGSSFWVNQVADPHDNPSRTLSERVVAYLNFDMVGRMTGTLSLYGVGSSSIWPREIEAANVRIGIPITPQQESSLPTDATVFYNRDVPLLAAFTGAHTDYHTPHDTADKLDYESLTDISRLMGAIGVRIASRSDRPDFQTSPAGARAPIRAHLRAYLGTVPDYARSDIMGVPLSSVKRAGPAERAGLRAGDVVIELAGRKIENIYDYTFAIEALKVGEIVRIVVLRNGEPQTFSVMPESRD